MKKVVFFVTFCMLFLACGFANPVADKNLNKFDVIFCIEYMNDGEVATRGGNFKEKIKAISFTDAIKKAKALLTKKYGKLLKFEVYYTIEYTKDGSKFRYQ